MSSVSGQFSGKVLEIWGSQHMLLNTHGDEGVFEAKGSSGVFMTSCPRCLENLVISRAASGLKLRVGSESRQEFWALLLKATSEATGVWFRL